jgi:hypothetical protein
MARAAALSAPASLLDASAAALNQNSKKDDKQNASYDAENQCSVHIESPFARWCFFLAVQFPRIVLAVVRAIAGVARNAGQPAPHRSCACFRLPDAGAAALNQERQADDKQNASYDAENQCSVHCDSSFPQISLPISAAG